jgi:hypothetical protein
MKNTILLVTNFYYQAKGREYFREDLALSEWLRNHFKVCISHIDDVEKVLPVVDAVLLRNTGPQTSHREPLKALQKGKLPLSNDLLGKGDIKGKHHLRELFLSGYPVIPTYFSVPELAQIDPFERYFLKPMDGADSSGVQILTHKELLAQNPSNLVIQPLVPIQYEVSFYFVDDQFHYALYAPDQNKRWELKTYTPTEEDIQFASKFIRWNTCKSGIQRVDGCRLPDGTLQLMELEDYNPYLSLDLLQKDVKERFLEALRSSLYQVMTGHRSANS